MPHWIYRRSNITTTTRWHSTYIYLKYSKPWSGTQSQQSPERRLIYITACVLIVDGHHSHEVWHVLLDFLSFPAVPVGNPLPGGIAVGTQTPMERLIKSDNHRLRLSIRRSDSSKDTSGLVFGYNPSDVLRPWLSRASIGNPPNASEQQNRIREYLSEKM